MKFFNNVVGGCVVAAGLMAASSFAGASTGGTITFHGSVVEDTCRATLTSMTAQRPQLSACSPLVAQSAQSRVLTGAKGRLQLPSAVADMVDDVNPKMDVVSVEYN